MLLLLHAGGCVVADAGFSPLSSPPPVFITPKVDSRRLNTVLYYCSMHICMGCLVKSLFCLIVNRMSLNL